MTIQIVEFPVELLKLITTNLSDKDLCNFVLTCRAFYGSVHGDQIVWRNRFLKVYDDPVNKVSYDWKGTYQKRRCLRTKMQCVSFYKGLSKEEGEALEMIWYMLLDARGTSTAGGDSVKGRNFSHLFNLRNGANNIIFSEDEDAHPLLNAVGLLLTPLTMTMKLVDDTQFESIRKIAYNNDEEWIINEEDGTPNVMILNAVAKTLMWHINPSSSSHLFYQRTLLTPAEFPGFWEGRMGDDVGLVTSKWFGAYTFSHNDESNNYLVDLSLNISWSKTIATGGVPFVGVGEDFDTFIIKHGEITPLPSPPGPLSALTGWKRVEFVKAYKNWEWIYEGVMLPGENMILGGWKRSKNAPLNNILGLFAFWRVPDGCSLSGRDNRLSLVRVAG